MSATVAASASSKKVENWVATRIFINQVPEYDSLPYCAEKEVSAIVRNMANGCGDGSKTTSYSCFCYDSSTHFSSLIGAHVQTACDGEEQATAAVEVFSDYCQIGLTKGLVATTTDVSASTTPASATSTPSSSPSSATSELLLDSASSPTGHSTLTPPTSSATAGASSSTPENSASSGTKVTAVAVGVVVPILVVAFAIGAFLFWRSRKRRTAGLVEKGGSDQPAAAWDAQRGYSIPSTRDGEYPMELATQEKGPYHVSELPDQRNRYSVAELDVHKTRFSAVELPGHTYR